MRANLEILNNKNVLFFGKGSINKEISSYLKVFDCQYSFVDSKSKKSSTGSVKTKFLDTLHPFESVILSV